MTFEAFLNSEAIKQLQVQEAASSKAQKRTPEQIEAIYTNGTNVLVSASAGSGKTFVMVERILDKILRGVGIDQLFISTFTVKAAGELKERIEKKLSETLSKTNHPALRQHLSTQLTNLENADIGTMDAFTQKLVTTYGYTIGVAPNFRILQDKNEQDLLKDEVFTDLFADYLKRADRDLFLALVKNFTGNGKDNRAFRSVVYQVHSFSQSTSNPKEWLKTTLLKGHENFRSLSDIPDSIIDGLLISVEQTADALEDLTYLPNYKRKTKTGAATATFKKHEVIFMGLRDLLATFPADNLSENFPSLIAQIVDLLPSGTDVTVAGVKYPIFKQLHNRLVDLQHLETILTYQPQALPILRLLQAFVLDFSDQYLQRKMQENAYEFSDISHFAIQILEENPAIRDHFSAKYHEVMVDEYQDNNHSQERMLDLLSNGHNRFMVGDIKQSIYRFRQADPQIFQGKFETYQMHPEQGKLILLKENFRSQNEVLDATNAIFTRLMDRQVGQIKYDQTHTLVAGSDRQRIAQPHHEMEYLIYNTDVTNEEGDITAGEVELVAKGIIRLVNEEQVAFSDITLLVPSRTRNQDILDSFEKHGIPLVSDGGEANYLKSVEVMVMLDTLRTINNPLNDYALVALLKSPMFAFDEDQLTRISLQSDRANLYEKIKLVLGQKGVHPHLIGQELLKKLEAFDARLNSWRRYAKNHAIHDLIWKIFNEKFYYDYVGGLPNGSKRQANLYALGTRANQFEKTGFKGLSRFISMVDKLLASDNDLADVEVALPQNAVQLMTVHKSKGLEFKYVFLLNMDKNFNAMESKSPVILSRENGIGIQYVADFKDRFDTLLPHVRVAMNTLPYQLNQQELKIANLSEQMRLLYVAMTRAELKLYLVGKGSQEKLADKYDGKRDADVLLSSRRESMTNFQDWILAIEEAFKDDNLHFKKTFINDEDLTPEKIGALKLKPVIDADNLKDNRQSKDIVRALDQLETVEKLNQEYRSAIELPSVRTPSQIKKFYESIMEEDGLAIMEKPALAPRFDLPDFGKNMSVTGAQIGSALHELMQRLPLEQKMTKTLLAATLAQVAAEDLVKENIDLDKVLAFFDTDLGREILRNSDKVRREATFASLQVDPVSKEQFVLRGIIDGFIHYPEENRMVLFDYKTDRYDDPEQLIARYIAQMNLYAAALQKAYQVDKIDKYLVLLGGESINVISI
ncbi:helicase-exonuclease AddAB subunit AddA [Streptococcus sp. X16XC17]|uniref:helicase-exonuclease AddAB subunit AddA n=1 Tax=unclassified Streptococcus TaxID=2608887 RepID=UPI00066FE549|nr:MULTISPECIES: helicase-exonuclease AddAB subunit AddA [unclassified Streptococcus]TCD46451.1 helicase-exonuclease AddAB subunit AddA [Streptococcus sp. X16XC17]